MATVWCLLSVRAFLSVTSMSILGGAPLERIRAVWRAVIESVRMHILFLGMSLGLTKCPPFPHGTQRPDAIPPPRPVPAVNGRFQKPLMRLRWTAAVAFLLCPLVEG